MTQRPPRGRALKGLARWMVGLSVGLALGFTLWLLRSTRVVEGWELQLVDLRTRWLAGERAPDPRIVVMQVLDPDVRVVARDMGTPWPWPLGLDGSILRFLKKAGVRAVVVDIYQFDAGAGLDDTPRSDALSEEQRNDVQGSEMEGEDFGKALRDVGNVVLAFELSDDPQYDVEARRLAVEPRLLARGVAPGEGALARRGANLPVRRASEGAAALGFANVPRDSDGIARRAAVAGRWNGRSVPSLALAAALLLDPGAAGRPQDGRLVRGDGTLLETAPDGTFFVDFRAPGRGAYARVSPSEVLAWNGALEREGALPPAARERLEGKVVVYGINLSGADDVLPTPVAGNFEGPEFQATVLDNLLHGGGRVPASDGLGLLLTLGLAGAVGAVGQGLRSRALPHLLCVGLLCGGVALAFAAFRGGTVLPLFAPVLAGLLAWGTTTGLKLFTEGRYNKWLEGTFSRYLAPSVIDALKENPALLQLGGVTRDVTVLFSDVAGFTKLSEALSSAQVVELLNRYLTPHCDAVFAEGGVVDKFIGDAVMAFYGDPIPQADHALRACRTALAVQAALPALEPVWRGMGLSEFVVRIGLNSGTAKVGNMGSAQRFDYTALGDTVNLASRLEGANKAFGTRILLGGSTYEQVRTAVLAKPLCRLGVVGRGEPVPVYELVALRERATPEQVAHVAAFEAAHACALRGEWDAALAHLARASRAGASAGAAEDGASEWLREIVHSCQRSAASTPWSGDLTLAGK